MIVALICVIVGETLACIIDYADYKDKPFRIWTVRDGYAYGFSLAPVEDGGSHATYGSFQ